MKTLVDSSVLIDVIEAQSDWAQWSLARILERRAASDLCINLIVYAEISRDFPSRDVLDRFLLETGIAVDSLNQEMAFQAARAHDAYRNAGGQKGATLADFFIGAHALVGNMPLLTRDPKRPRTYFPGIQLICPDPE